jgi:hypothetical protein
MPKTFPVRPLKLKISITIILKYNKIFKDNRVDSKDEYMNLISQMTKLRPPPKKQAKGKRHNVNRHFGKS